MAEVLLRHHLERAGVDAAVSSAGLHPGGRPATDHGVATMAARGLDLSGHRSRALSRDLLERADLVLGMTREHVREVAVLDRPALDRTFTLKELVRAAESAAPRGPDEPLPAWLRRVAGGRHRDLLGVDHDPAYDVEDPIGRGRQEYEATAHELDDLLRRLVALLFPTNDREHVG